MEGIHNGEVTHHHDQSILSSNFNTRNTMNVAPHIPIPPLDDDVLLLILSPFFHCKLLPPDFSVAPFSGNSFRRDFDRNDNACNVPSMSGWIVFSVSFSFLDLYLPS
jgi:hypothetical protein